MKNELLTMICQKSFQFSKEPIYRLVSGKMSRFYVNCKPTVLHPRGIFLVGHMVLDAVKNSQIKGIGGLTFGADPIAIATAFASELRGCPIQAFSVRKTQKDHGIVKWIEGDLNPGDRVAIVDDVVTTGGSTIKAIERSRSEGLNVVQVVILVDRQEGGLENIREQIANTTALISRDELMSHAEKNKTNR